MIVTVTPNPAIDITFSVDRITPDGTHRVESMASRAGGKGLNVARVLQAQGHPVHAIATAGGATGAELAINLAGIRLPHSLVGVTAPTRRSVALHDRHLDQTTIFNEVGAELSAAEWAAFETAIATAMPGCRCLVASGSLPPGASAGFLPGLVASARAAGIPCVVDTSGPALLEAARAGATILKPNAAELREATGEADPVAGARRLIALGATQVVVSLGAEGMLIVGGADSPVLRARLPRPLVGNPTGAGDAAVAAIAAALHEGQSDPELLLRVAAAWSAAAVLMPLAGEISTAHTSLGAQLIVEDVR